MQRQNVVRSAGVAAAVLAMLVLSSCKVDWATWGFGRERTGYNPAESTISPANVSQLRQQWATSMPSPPSIQPPPANPARSNTAPVVAISININGQATDVVYAGNEEGAFHAISTTGQILWSRDLGRRFANCPDTPDMYYGVSASAVFDRTHNRVYVVGGDGYLYALDPATGATLPGWPVQLTSDPSHEFVYSAPTQSGTSLYIGIASRCDATPYHGRLVRIDTETRASSAFFVTGSPTGPSGGAIWGWGGASVDPGTGDVFVATGNTIANPETAFYGDHIVRLNADLGVVAAHTPGIGIEDDDFGSTPVLFRKSGCPGQLVTEQKNGSLYLYDRDAISGGYRQKITLETGAELIGVPAYSPATQMVYVVNSGASGVYAPGLLAFRLDASCNLQLAWQSASPVALGSTPTIANGVVYYTDGFRPAVHAVNASTGAALWSSGAELTQTVIATPVVVNGQLFVTSYDGKLHAYGLP